MEARAGTRSGGAECDRPLVEPVRTIPGTSVRLVSDEEMLALLKDRPIALIGQPGRQRLVLLDEPVP